MTYAVFGRAGQPMPDRQDLPAFRCVAPNTLKGSTGRMIFARSIRNKLLRYLNLRNHSDELFERFARVDDADWWFRVKPLIDGRMSKGKLAATILMLGEMEAS